MHGADSDESPLGCSWQACAWSLRRRRRAPKIRLPRGDYTGWGNPLWKRGLVGYGIIARSTRGDDESMAPRGERGVPRGRS